VLSIGVWGLDKFRGGPEAGARHFCPKDIDEKLTKCPNFTWFLPEKILNYSNFKWYLPVKLTKFPNFTWFFRKMPELLLVFLCWIKIIIIIARKYFPEFCGRVPPPQAPTPMVPKLLPADCIATFDEDIYYKWKIFTGAVLTLNFDLSCRSYWSFMPNVIKSDFCCSSTHFRHEDHVNELINEPQTNIGVGAQSTLGGTTFLPEKYVWKMNKMPEFYMILARNVIEIPEFYICPKN